MSARESGKDEGEISTREEITIYYLGNKYMYRVIKSNWNEKKCYSVAQ